MSDEPIGTRYTIIRPGVAPSKAETGCVDWPKKPGYKRIKNLVEPILGDYMEHVTVYWPSAASATSGYTDMFVDGSGQLKRLPLNAFATRIYRHNWLVHEPEKAAASKLATIRGIAVLFHRKVWY